jgi:hypothetical protein
MRQAAPVWAHLTSISDHPGPIRKWVHSGTCCECGMHAMSVGQRDMVSCAVAATRLVRRSLR